MRPRPSKQQRPARRAADRALVPVRAAAAAGIPVAVLARAMRAAGVEGPLDPKRARQWARDPRTAPDWFHAVLAEQAALAAQRLHRKEQREEQAELQSLAAQQSAQDKIGAGDFAFTDREAFHAERAAWAAARGLVRGGAGGIHPDEAALLLHYGIVASDHATWPLHMAGCDGAGAAHCTVRREDLRIERRAEDLIASVQKQDAAARLGVAPGDVVELGRGGFGIVVKVNRVTVKVRYIRGGGPVERNLDPRYLRRADPPAGPAVGEPVQVHYRGRDRAAVVAAADGPLLETALTLQSGAERRHWVDVGQLRRP